MGVFKDFVEFVGVSVLDFFIFVIYCVKVKTIRKIVYQTKSKEKSFIKIVKRRKKAVKMIIKVYNGTLDFLMLFESQIIQR